MRLDSPNLLLGVLIAVLVPIAGFWVGSQRLTVLEARAAHAFGLDMATACERGLGVMMSGSCGAYEAASYLRLGSLLTGGVGLALVLAVALLAAWAGTDRERNARAFPTLIPPAIVVIGLITVSQVALLVVTLHTLGLRGGWLGALAVGGLIAAVVLLLSLRTLLRRSPIYELAVVLPQRQGSQVVTLVREVAAAVGAKAPTNVIVGTTPNFYATSAEVALPARAPTPGATLLLSGETLYLSLPLLRLFSREEVQAVIGHELGHFIGQDALYSQRFAPAYQALLTGLDELESWRGNLPFWVAQLPAVTLISYLLGQFAVNERRISRERELEADRIGAAAGSAAALGSALVKMGLTHELWPQLALEQDPPPGRGRRAGSPSLSDRLLALVRSSKPDSLRATANLSVRKSVPHPTDTHPQTAERLRALGVKPADIDFAFAETWSDDEAVAEEIGRLEQEVAALERMFEGR